MGSWVSTHKPIGIPSTAPTPNTATLRHATSRQTKGSMWRLAAISKRNAAGTTSAGGSSKACVVTMSPENPKPV